MGAHTDTLLTDLVVTRAGAVAKTATGILCATVQAVANGNAVDAVTLEADQLTTAVRAVDHPTARVRMAPAFDVQACAGCG